jgi:putative chitobiose transport system permease protein
MLPLAAPTLATLALFSIIGAWSDLLWPLIVLQSREQMTLPVAVNTLLSTFSTNVRAAYAGAVLSLIPIILIFALLQRFMKPEMFGGAVKG